MTNPKLISYSMIRAESFSFKIMNKKGRYTFTTFILHSIRSSSHSNQTKINK